jgi:Icc-related predicted phosphoesterase
MKIKILNDIHLEFDAHGAQFEVGGPADVLLLSGDVCVASYLRPNRTDKMAARHREICEFFFKTQCAKFGKVYYIMGNHEHYHGIFDYTAEILREFLEGTNVTLLDNEFVALNDEWQLFGGTLWTDYNNNDWFARNTAKDRMSDHMIIKKLLPQSKKNPYGEPFGRFLPTDAYDEHKKTLDALQNGLYEWKQIDKKTIVMTHHAPTFQSVHPRFAGDELNYAYATDLSEMIMDNPNIKYWLHGHMHDTHDYNVGECRVVCNPRGYQGYELNDTFDPDFNIEI